MHKKSRNAKKDVKKVGGVLYMAYLAAYNKEKISDDSNTVLISRLLHFAQFHPFLFSFVVRAKLTGN